MYTFFPICFCSGCPLTASVCMIRSGSSKVNVIGLTSTQRMSVNGELACLLVVCFCSYRAV